MNTTELRSNALESFVTAFNLCYPDREVEGDASTELTADHVEYSYTTASWAKCGPRKNGHVYFALNSDWYANAAPGERLGLLLHELAHVEVLNHSPEFWEQVVDNYRSVEAHRQKIADSVLGDLSWPVVREFIITDPLTQSVDNRRETAYERRLKLAEALEVPTDEIDPFDGMHIKYLRPSGSSEKTVPVSRLTYNEMEPDEVVEYFHSRPRNYLTKVDSRHIIQPLPVRKRGTTYEIVECDEMANLAEMAGLQRVTVEVENTQAETEPGVQEGSAD